MILIGADENGLGPWLGPLIVTGVQADMSSEPSHAGAITRLRHSATLAHSLGINDSKATSHFRKMQHCESIALGLLTMLHTRTPSTADDVLHLVSVATLSQLQQACPDSSRPQCWRAEIRLPAWQGDAQAGAHALAMWSRAAGMTLLRAASKIFCVKTFNEALTRLPSKSHVNLSGFEAVLATLMPVGDTPFQAVCGRNGAMKSYGPHLRDLSISMADARETPSCSEYTCGPQGKIRFEVNADSLDPLVGLASMLGKYLRELWMLRSNTFYQSHDPDLPSVSGYRDPKTRDWIAKTATLRTSLDISPVCFMRNK